MSGTLTRLRDRLAALGADADDGPELALRKRMGLALALVPIPTALLWALAYGLQGSTTAALAVSGYALISMANVLVFARSRHLPSFRVVQLTTILLVPGVAMVLLGGFAASSGVVLWAALCPLAALLVGAASAARGWLLAYLALLAVGLLGASPMGASALPPAFVLAMFALNFGGVVAIAFGILRSFVAQRDYYAERSEALLLNVLPREITRILREETRTIATHHEEATILFADVVGFTRMAAELPPMELVGILDEVFLDFDRLVDRYGVEKIKTIGDCYMAAAGVPSSRPDHAEALVGLAVDMATTVAARSYRGRRLAFRIGLNSGPVVAGVIGRKKFIYDLWGDAVNLASRMETHGESGVVQITRATFERVRETFHCEERGWLEIKGGGRLEAWRVLGRRPA